MSYLVFCTFDLKNASSKDYETAYSELKGLGLQKVQKADSGTNVVIPTTSVMGTVDGTSVGSVRDDICNKIQARFKARGFKTEIFVIVGGNWAWGGRTT